MRVQAELLDYSVNSVTGELRVLQPHDLPIAWGLYTDLLNCLANLVAGGRSAIDCQVRYGAEPILSAH